MFDLSRDPDTIAAEMLARADRADVLAWLEDELAGITDEATALDCCAIIDAVEARGRGRGSVH